MQKQGKESIKVYATREKLCISSNIQPIQTIFFVNFVLQLSNSIFILLNLRLQKRDKRKK